MNLWGKMLREGYGVKQEGGGIVIKEGTVAGSMDSGLGGRY